MSTFAYRFGIAWRIIGIVFGLFMVFMTLKGLFLIHNDFRNLAEKGKTAIGTVLEKKVRYSTSPNTSNRTTYTIRFETEDGRSITYKDTTYTDLGLEEGQQVRVKYMPDNPGYAMVASKKQEENTSLTYGMFVVLAAGFLAAAVFLCLNLRKHIRKQSGRN